MPITLMHQSNKVLFHLGFFSAQAFALQTGQNHGLGKFAPLLRTHMPALLQNIPMPLQPHEATIVLSALTRS